jgi:purine catabolism regulator
MLLGDLIAHPPLGLELATTGGRLDRVVKGAHAIDLLPPAPWIGSGYVVLTTGLALRGSAARQREFVSSVADADAAAVGLGVGVVFKSIPRPMLETAEERGLALFTVPYAVPFRDIIRFVTASTLRGEAAQLARVIAIQDDLLAVVERANGERELVERLGALLDARVALFSAEDGRVVAVAGHPPLKELWDLARTGVRATPFAPRGYALVREVEVAGALRYHLAVLTRSGDRAETVARPVVGFAARALQMIAAGRELEAQSDRIERSALLHDLLEAERVDRRLVARLRRIGFRPGPPLRALVASPGDDAVRAAVDALLARAGPARLVDVAGDDVVAVWQGDDDVAGGLVALAAEHASLAVGTATALDDASDLGRALAEARACLLAARSRATARDRVVESGSLSLSDSLVALLPRAQAARVDDLLAPLETERPDALATLAAFFEHDLDIMACARALHLHPNSLRYRLAKIEAVLGRSLRSPGTIADLHLALRARALAGDRPAGA